MTISATIILRSKSQETGKEVATVMARYPHFIHAELMTHKDFSRNASSSRAIPIMRLIKNIIRDPAMPIYWGSNKPNMQAGAQLTGWKLWLAKKAWLGAMWMAIGFALILYWIGLHKQIGNRILEPWAHINTLITSSRWNNFYALRIHPDAQPEIHELAKCIKESIAAAPVQMLQRGMWHLPFASRAQDWNDAYTHCKVNRITRDEPRYEEKLAHLKLISTARCARVSYLTHDGRETTFEEDRKLADRLIGSTPLHASPAEHQCTPDWYDQKDAMMSRHAGDGKNLSWQPEWENSHLHGNLSGWIQFRKTLKGEYVN